MAVTSTKMDRNKTVKSNRKTSRKARTLKPTSRARMLSWKEPTDQDSFAFSFELGLALLQQDQEWTSAVRGSWRRLLHSVVESSDYLGFIECTSYLRGLLVSSGSWETTRVSASLSQGRWVRGLIAAIDHSLPQQGQLAVVPNSDFDKLATFLGWLKRLPVSVPTEEQSSDGYFRTDRRLSAVDVEGSRYLPGLRQIWKEWFGEFQLDESFRPYHSSGSTADAGRVRHDKWEAIRIDSIARVCLRPRSLRPVDLGAEGTLSRVAKVTFVPKAAGKRRVICMEPATLQYLQHGVADQLIAYASNSRHPLHTLVDIRSQERNRELCARAYDEELATIDLSDASDSVSWRLVKSLTFGMPLGRYLKGTRSTWTLLQGYKMRMDKYAPMGSALCFPIECYVFASIVELARRIHTGKTGAGYPNGCSVYGDDIIVPASLYQGVVDILTSLGFIVNQSKSFSTGIYYESCGVEYCHGWRVNTVRHPRAHLINEEECLPDRVGMITDLANTLYTLGYWKARRLLLKSYEGVVVRVNQWKSAPFMSCLNWGQGGILSIEPCRRRRFIRSIQSTRHVYTGLRTVASIEESDFQQWLSNSSRRTREQRLHELYRQIRPVDPLPCFSVRAVVCLSRMMPSILEGIDVKDVGSCHTGRLRWEARKSLSIPCENVQDRADSSTLHLNEPD